jgi:cysteine desulfurase
VVRITGNFTSESPLHPAAREALLAAFDQGWADPKKLSQASKRAAIMRNQALEEIASKLNLPADSLEVIGEPALGHYLSIAGLIHENSNFAFSEVDKGKVRAISRKTQSTCMRVDGSGKYVNLSEIPSNSVLSWQLANGETGVIQKQVDAVPENVLIAVDATSAGPREVLPTRWDTALFDSKSWSGPQGLAIMSIKDRARYQYPLPRIAPINSPGSYSLPLLIASAIALQNFAIEDRAMRNQAIATLSRLDGVAIVAPDSPSLPHILSAIFEGVSAERVVQELSSRGIDIDSGSACSAQDLQPSHVIAAMGLPTEGHLRFTFHQGGTIEDVELLCSALSEVISELRR